MKGLKKKFQLSLEGRRDLTGLMFISPFIIGFSLFVLDPIIRSIIFSIHKMELHAEGYSLHFEGLSNYYRALFVEPHFIQHLTATVGRMLTDLPVILIFSFFIAVILNQKFRGRFVARIIFFLPVIMGSGIILQMEQADYMTRVLQVGVEEEGGHLFSYQALGNFVMQMQLPEVILEYIVSAVERLTEIIRASAIQILIFLAGLQSISSSLYEAARVEGATGWEIFWKVTLPMLSPLIIVNMIYTIIDFFTSPHNQLLGFIRTVSFGSGGFGVGTAMSWMYFVLIALVLSILVGIALRWVYLPE